MKLAALVVVMLLSLGWVLRDLHPATALQALAQVRWGAMAGVLGLYVVTHALRVWRFRLLLVGRPPPYWTTWNLVSAGFLAIHTVPLRMGELVRPWLLAEKAGVPFGVGLAAVFLERMLDVAMLVTLLVGVGFTVDLPPLVVQGVDVVHVGQRAGATLLLGGGIAGAGLLVAPERALRPFDRVRLVGLLLRRFRDGLRGLVARPGVAVTVGAVSVAVWVATVAAVDLGLAAFPGLPTGVAAASATWATTSATMTAVPTPGFFGPFEAGCAGAVQLLGGPPDVAGAFALVFHLSQFGFVVVTGGLGLLVEGVSLGDAVRKSRAVGLAPVDGSS